MNRHEEEWAKAFEGGNEAEILAAALPPNLTYKQCVRFRSIQTGTAAAARQTEARAREQALLGKAMGEMAVAARLQPAFEAAPQDAPEPESRREMVVPNPPLPLAIPSGKTDALLDRQIASCAGIIEHLARYIGRYDTAAETCNKFMDRIGLLMKSSSEAALAAGRLRGMAPEGRPRR